MKTMRQYQAGFTLFELMMVIGLVGMIALWGLPAIFKLAKEESLRQSVNHIVEVCGHARAQAILQGRVVELVFRPQERLVAVGSGGGSDEQPGAAGLVAGAPGATRASARWSDRVALEMLDVNFVEYKDAEEARVRFFPNGMCDELTLIVRSEQNEYRKITLEVTTGLAEVEVIR